jgi:hypothetical protein
MYNKKLNDSRVPYNNVLYILSLTKKNLHGSIFKKVESTLYTMTGTVC